MFAKHLTNLLGGSANLAPSAMTWMDDCGTYSAETPTGRNFHWGIQEHRHERRGQRHALQSAGLSLSARPSLSSRTVAGPPSA